MPKKTTTDSVKKVKKDDAKVVIDPNAKIVTINDEQKVLVTKEGLKKLNDELENLKTVKRDEIAQKLQEAISYGDLSENAEYSEAKDEQAFVEARIIELQSIIEKAEIISASHATSVVELGCTVCLHNLTLKKDEKYTIVGSTEADPFNGFISNESPVGKALLGCSAGENVKVNAPKGVIEYKITKIE